MFFCQVCQSDFIKCILRNFYRYSFFHFCRCIIDKRCYKQIFIRYFKLPRIDNHLRITVGTDEQMDALIAALKQIL